MATKRIRKRHHVMTADINVRTGKRGKARSIVDYARKDRAMMIAAMFGPLAWVEAR